MKPVHKKYHHDTQSTGHIGVAYRLQQQQENTALETLTKCESDQIDAIASEYKQPERKYSANSNILEILKKIPEESARKLKVIIATHEGNGLITYFRTSYSCHMFILAKTDDGLTIFDPRIPKGSSMKSRSWIKCVYEKYPLLYALKNSYTLQYLPQFRFLDALTYIDQYEDACEFNTLHPEFALLEMGKGKGKGKERNILESELWKKSFRLNLYEVNQLFTEATSYEDTMNYHKDQQSPLDRIKAEEIIFLRQFFEST